MSSVPLTPAHAKEPHNGTCASVPEWRDSLGTGHVPAKEIYRALCETGAGIPLFSQAWWLDAVTVNGSWDVALVANNKQVMATMPYCMYRRMGRRLIVHPPLTQTMGPWIRKQDECDMKRLSREKRLMNALISQLPPFDHFEQRWHHSMTNWLPFHWAGFQQTTRYTYVIDDISHPDTLPAGFALGKRQDLKKASRLDVRFNIPARAFYDHHAMTLKQRNARILYSFDVFQRIYEEGHRRHAACTVGAFDTKGTMHAGLFIVWDSESAYGLINTIDQTLKSSGASTLLTMEVIRHVSSRTRMFDFEGSMIEGVEASVRQYNTRQVPYLSVSKTPCRLYALARFLKTLKTHI
ncbi:GNAT family N-acetyltransferase [Allopusillimonas soli]|uniref:GNAT family N-acetyltransferase n=1 Tax=Allopusillimonas soli TaxID=659016 RepID=A0A853FJN9_9BURK|nr:GNAT family N-acetyltransferase [Allopusillimonas soli]NYT38950.1 GNAT family N-acetyltransferase [Allopusillimonas soli]TEA70056.1 GNAT family N-acetyltransferase [Allopusillimonas soli]